MATITTDHARSRSVTGGDDFRIATVPAVRDVGAPGSVRDFGTHRVAPLTSVDPREGIDVAARRVGWRSMLSRRRRDSRCSQGVRDLGGHESFGPSSEAGVMTHRLVRRRHSPTARSRRHGRNTLGQRHHGQHASRRCANSRQAPKVSVVTAALLRHPRQHPSPKIHHGVGPEAGQPCPNDKTRVVRVSPVDSALIERPSSGLAERDPSPRQVGPIARHDRSSDVALTIANGSIRRRHGAGARGAPTGGCADYDLRPRGDELGRQPAR
jgi:hypothetical protein